MKENKYLPSGSTIADKYEVVDVLGEDEFEILYLVRDINRKGSFFVLKELFLETFSKREGELVFTVPEALGVFHKRKKEIIEEIKTQKLNSLNSEIKIYGYEDENNTVYTIMEFSNNASLEKYLQFTPKDVKSLPALDTLIKKKKSFNYAPILKILLSLGLVSGITFYGYRFFQQNSLEKDDYALKKPVSKNFPKLKERVTSVEKPEVQTHVALSSTTIVKQKHLKKEENRTEVVSKVIKKPMVSTPPIVEEKIIATLDNHQSNEDKVVAVSEEKKVTKKKSMIKVKHSASLPIKERLKAFLDKYIMASARSKEGTLRFYDKHVKRYFKFKNPTHKTILRSQKIYNRKWVHREFKISYFKILKSYQKHGVHYYNLQTTTVWHIKSKRGKKISGKSRGFMTVKEVGDGFKITSIK